MWQIIKTVETYTYYVIYNFNKKEYYSGINDLGYYRIEYKFSKILKDAVLFDSRVDANEYVREWVDRGNNGTYKVKKVECSYAIA